MRKLFLGAAMLLMANVSFGQLVSDNAVIPVSVTLNSILRLTVTSGGNINFVFNTIDQYENGLGPGGQYTTIFTVASSRDFDVILGAEDNDFIGFETGNSIELDYLGFNVTGPGADSDFRLLEVLTTVGLVPIVDGGAGRASDNEFEIAWEFATSTVLGESGRDDLLTRSFNADIYMTNVFLSVSPK
jgi:hypothetical protein